MSRFWKPGAERPQLLDDEEVGVLFVSAPSSGGGGYGYANLERQRQRFPVYKFRTATLYHIENHATCIVVGETGSGKTTQVPQVMAQLSRTQKIDSSALVFEGGRFG